MLIDRRQSPLGVRTLPGSVPPTRGPRPRPRQRWARGTDTLDAESGGATPFSTYARPISLHPSWMAREKPIEGVLHELMAEGMVFRAAKPISIYTDLIEVRFEVTRRVLCAAWGRWWPITDDLIAIEFHRITRTLAAYLEDLERLRRGCRAGLLDCTMAPHLYLRHVTFAPPDETGRRVDDALDVAPGRCAQFWSCECDQPASNLCQACLKPICLDHTSVAWKLETHPPRFDRGRRRPTGGGLDIACHTDRLCLTCSQLQLWAQQPLAIISERQRSAFLRSPHGQQFLGEWELRPIATPLG